MRTKNTPYGNAVNETNPVLGPGIYGYIISRFGTQNKDNAVGDKYYLAVDASGRLYGGAQVNNATDITWKRTTTKDDLPFGFIYGDHKYGAVLYLAYTTCGIVKCTDGNFSDTKLG